MPLTIKGIEAIKPRFNKAKGRCIPVKRSDGDGLIICVTDQSKTWCSRYFWGGKEQNPVIGHYPLMSLAEARDKNREIRKMLDQGKNPQEYLKLKKLEQKAALEKSRAAKGEDHPDSLKSVAEDWLSQVKKKWKPKSYKAEVKRLRKHLIGTLGHRMIGDIRAQEDIRPIFEGLEREGKYTTLKKVAEKTISIFNFAIALGKTDNNPAYAIWKGLVFTKPPTNNSLPSITDPQKIGKLLLDIDSYLQNALQSPNARRSIEVCYAAKILPYLFLRPSNLAEGEWSEIDWDKKLWFIPGSRMKNGKDFVVPLSRQVLALLKEVQGYTGHQKYIFYSKLAKKNGHIAIESINKVYGHLGYRGEMCGHGWRHAFVTNCKESLKYSSDIIYKQMSHTLEKDSAKATYDKAEFLAQRVPMMQDYADYLDSLKRAARGGGEASAQSKVRVRRKSAQAETVAAFF